MFVGANVAAIRMARVMVLRDVNSEIKHDKMNILYTYPQMNNFIVKSVAFYRLSSHNFQIFELFAFLNF